MIKLNEIRNALALAMEYINLGDNEIRNIYASKDGALYEFGLSTDYMLYVFYVDPQENTVLGFDARPVPEKEFGIEMRLTA